MKEQNNSSCCSAHSTQPPDHSSEIHRIRRIQGQLDGICKMIEERRYCPDILTQTRAVRSAIKALEGCVLQRHIETCVRDAFLENADQIEKKASELVELFKKNIS